MMPADLVSANYDTTIQCSQAVGKHEPCGLDKPFACGLGLACVAESITHALCEPVCAPGFSDKLLYTEAAAAGCTIDTTDSTALTRIKDVGKLVLLEGTHSNVAVPKCLVDRNLAVDSKPFTHANVAQRAAAQAALAQEADFEMDLKGVSVQSSNAAAEMRHTDDMTPDGSDQLARSQFAAQLIGLNLLFFEVRDKLRATTFCATTVQRLFLWLMLALPCHVMADQPSAICNTQCLAGSTRRAQAT